MRKTIITELRGQWVVSVEVKGRRQQEYVCETLALARRWALLFGLPPRAQTKAKAEVRAQLGA